MVCSGMRKLVAAVIADEGMAGKDRDAKKAGCAVVPVDMVGTAFRAGKIIFRIFNGMFYLQGKLFVFLIIVQGFLSFFKVFIKNLQLDSPHSLGKQPVRLDQLFVRNKTVDACIGKDLFVPVGCKGIFIKFKAD